MIKRIDGFSAAEIATINEAVTCWNAVWNTQEFKNTVLEFYYLNSLQAKVPSFFFAQGEKEFTNQEVLDRIIRIWSDGKCYFNIVKKWSWKFWSSAVASTDYNSQTVTIYSSYFRRASIGDLINTLSHEAGCHCAGFEHEFKYSHVRDFYSVPYAIGRMTQNIYELHSNNDYWHKIGDDTND